MINPDPLVSIITPAYNAASYIEETIQSVLDQTYENWELIVVNDGSTDETGQRVKSFSDQRILLIEQANQGMGASRNIGIAKSNGQYLAFIDADDCWMPDKLAKQIEIFDQRNVDFIHTSGHYFDKINRPFVTPDISNKGKNLLPTLILKNVIAIPSVIMKKEHFYATKGFLQQKELGIVADFHLWLQLCELNIQFHSMSNDHLIKYRVHDQQATSWDKLPQTTQAVCKMLTLLERDQIITKQQFKMGCTSHIRMLIDQIMLNSSKAEYESTSMMFESYNFINSKLKILKYCRLINRRMAQIISWRLLKVS